MSPVQEFTQKNSGLSDLYLLGGGVFEDSIGGPLIYPKIVEKWGPNFDF